MFDTTIFLLQIPAPFAYTFEDGNILGIPKGVTAWGRGERQVISTPPC